MGWCSSTTTTPRPRRVESGARRDHHCAPVGRVAQAKSGRPAGAGYLRRCDASSAWVVRSLRRARISTEDALRESPFRPPPSAAGCRRARPRRSRVTPRCASVAPRLQDLGDLHGLVFRGASSRAMMSVGFHGLARVRLAALGGKPPQLFSPRGAGLVRGTRAGIKPGRSCSAVPPRARWPSKACSSPSRRKRSISRTTGTRPGQRGATTPQRAGAKAQGRELLPSSGSHPVHRIDLSTRDRPPRFCGSLHVRGDRASSPPNSRRASALASFTWAGKFRERMPIQNSVSGSDRPVFP